MIYYLMSGFDKELGFSGKVGVCLAEDLKGAKSITFIPTSLEDTEKVDIYINMNLRWFENIGIMYEKVNVIVDEISIVDAQAYIESSDVVFLMGGLPDAQYKLIMDKQIDKTMKGKKNGMVIGVSAGSLNMAQNCIITRDEDYPDPIILPSIKLVDINVEIHFDENDEVRVDDVKYLSKQVGSVYCIKDDSAIRIENGDSKFIGDGIFVCENDNMQTLEQFENELQISKVTKNKKLTKAKKVTATVLVISVILGFILNFIADNTFNKIIHMNDTISVISVPQSYEKQDGIMKLKIGNGVIKECKPVVVKTISEFNNLMIQGDVEKLINNCSK